MEGATEPLGLTEHSNTYTKREQESDFAVLVKLAQSFPDGKTGLLSDYAELLFRVLSDRCLARAKADLQKLSPKDWMEKVFVASALAACSVVCLGFENEFNKGSDHGTDIEPSPVDIRLGYRAAAWLTMFIQSTGILEHNNGPLVNVGLVDSVGISLWTILLSAFVKPAVQHPPFPLHDAVLGTYIYLARNSTATMSLEEGHYFAILSNVFSPANAQQDSHPGSLWSAIERHAGDLAGVFIAKITAYIDMFSRNMDQPWVRMVAILQFITTTFKSPRVRRQLSARGMLPLLCRLFHHAVHAKIDIVTWEDKHTNPRFSLIYILRPINHLLQGGDPSATVALEARLLPNLFHTQPLLDDSRDTDDTSITELRQSVEDVMVSLEQQLFHRSALQVFFKSDRYVERLRVSGSISQGVLWPMICRLRSLAEKRKEEMAMVKMGRVACANSHCTSVATNADVQIKRCLGCLTAEYCSSRCRCVHWKTGGHRSSCVEIRNLRKSGSTLAPIPTRDMNFIYHLVIQEMERRQAEVLELLRECQDTLQVYPSGAIRGSSETHPDDWIFADTILVFDFSPLIPMNSVHFPEIQFTVSSTATFPDFLTKEPYYCDFDVERFQKTVRTRRSRGPFIAIISRSKLLDLTNMDCIISREYSFWVYQ